MPSIVVYYRPQPDPDTFEKRYLDEHIPLVRGWEGVKDFSFNKVTRPIMGEFPYSHIFVAAFESEDAMKSHLKSEAMKRSAEHASEIAPNGFDAVMVDQLS